MIKRIVIFASGSGSNAENIAQYFNKKQNAEVVAIFCNNPKAGVIARAKRLEIPCHIFNRQDFQSGENLDKQLNNFKPDLIVLAGFLWLFPNRLLEKYPKQVINIHPALLPRHGGKGMYGNRVHQAVLDAADKTHGVTVHFVNEHFDEGEIILQESFEIQSSDNLESMVSKIHEIEFNLYPRAIEKILG